MDNPLDDFQFNIITLGHDRMLRTG